MFIKRLLFGFLTEFLVSVVALADETASVRQMGKVSSPVDMMQWTLALMLVLAVFFIFVWLLRKSNGFALINKGQLGILAGLSLGMREKLVLVKVGEKELLLGVTAGQINKLLELEGDQRLFQNQARQSETDIFAKKLMQLMQGKANE